MTPDTQLIVQAGQTVNPAGEPTLHRPTTGPPSPDAAAKQDPADTRDDLPQDIGPRTQP
jgi:hypothetical protein